MFAFSATSSKSVERLVFKTLSMPKKLTFISEYEFIHGISPLQEGHIIPCGSFDNVLGRLKDEMIKTYDSKPLIVISEENQIESIFQIVKSEKFQSFRGTSKETMMKIKELTCGVLLITDAECRGMDIRFGRDAKVLITANV